MTVPQQSPKEAKKAAKEAKKAARKAEKAAKQAAARQREIERKRQYTLWYDSREIWVMLGNKRIQGGSLWGVRVSVSTGGYALINSSAGPLTSFWELDQWTRNVRSSRTVTISVEGPAFRFVYHSYPQDPSGAYAFAAEVNRLARALDGQPQ